MIEDKQHVAHGHQKMLDNKAELFEQMSFVKNHRFNDQPIGLWDFCQPQKEAGMIKNREVEQMIFRDR
ncbi:MAG: hypothetical protein HWQ41_04705 [Nostoc sp. NOS(2021)]|uniref:hypothetical protein n=1 Tax=Nostoc sp. NOS(2021) TaxID=2815407 RepID=UPI0025EFF96A|nr:hypothetical protein [Nostoc sp. NOS(2021)]MBN3894576.1 hypothetical protein [Nostoc sp. NOS(2021)]